MMPRVLDFMFGFGAGVAFLLLFRVMISDPRFNNIYGGILFVAVATLAIWLIYIAIYKEEI